MLIIHIIQHTIILIIMMIINDQTLSPWHVQKSKPLARDGTVICPLAAAGRMCPATHYGVAAELATSSKSEKLSVIAV